VRIADVRHRVDCENEVAIPEEVLVHQVAVEQHLARRAGGKQVGRRARLLDQRFKHLARVVSDRKLPDQVPIDRLGQRRERHGRRRRVEELGENIGDGVECLAFVTLRERCARQRPARQERPLVGRERE
jgi:hypothetical protein